jgi:hypothetical protein
MSDENNFAAVFVETLTPELKERFAAIPNPTAADIWEIVLANHIFVRDPAMFVELGTGKCVAKDVFNATYAPVVNDIEGLPIRYRDKPVQYARSTYGMKLASSADYMPVKNGEPWSPLVGIKYNMWRPPAITPLRDGRKPSVFIEHMHYVFPNRVERLMVANYLAWMVQRPEHKMSFGLLIVGRRGVGKSWFQLLCTMLFGHQNVLFVEKGADVAAKFNADQANKQVIFVDELLPGGKMDVAYAIESKIVAPTITIEPKGIDKFRVSNLANCIGVSNYENALKVRGANDRKWAVARANSDMIFGTDENKETAATRDYDPATPPKTTGDYFTRLHSMVTPLPDDSIPDEARRTLAWLLDRKIPIEFNGHIPPDTEAKRDIAASTADEIEANINGMYADASGPFRFKLVTVEEVRESACNLFEPGSMSRQMADAQASSAMDDCGCRRITPAASVDDRSTPAPNAQVYVAGSHNPRRLWCTRKADLPKYERMTKGELTEAYKAERKGVAVEARLGAEVE